MVNTWKIVGKVMFDGNNKKHYLLTNNTNYKILVDTGKTDFNEALTKSRLLNYSIFVNV